MLNKRANLLLGLLLLVGGFLLLLVNFEVLGDLTGQTWGLLLTAGGLAFVSVYLSNRQQWWPLIPGAALIGVGLLVLLSTFGFEGAWLPAIIFLAIGAAFLVIYLTQPDENWWAIIPGGVMASLALTVVSGELGGAAIMLGLGFTFGLVYLQGVLRGLHQQFWWALIPGGILSVIGLFLLADSVEQLAWIGRLWPLALILIGLLVLLRGSLGSREER